MTLRYCVTAKELATYMHISKQTIHKYLNRLNLPTKLERDQVEQVIDAIRRSRAK